MLFVDCVNAVHDNVWALLIIGGGVILMLRGHASEGGLLVTLGAAIFQKQKATEQKPV